MLVRNNENEIDLENDRHLKLAITFISEMLYQDAMLYAQLINIKQLLQKVDDVKNIQEKEMLANVLKKIEAFTNMCRDNLAKFYSESDLKFIDNGLVKFYNLRTKGLDVSEYDKTKDGLVGNSKLLQSFIEGDIGQTQDLVKLYSSFFKGESYKRIFKETQDAVSTLRADITKKSREMEEVDSSWKVKLTENEYLYPVIYESNFQSVTAHGMRILLTNEEVKKQLSKIQEVDNKINFVAESLKVEIDQSAEIISKCYTEIVERQNLRELLLKDVTYITRSKSLNLISKYLIADVRSYNVSSFYNNARSLLEGEVKLNHFSSTGSAATLTNGIQAIIFRNLLLNLAQSDTHTSIGDSNTTQESKIIELLSEVINRPSATAQRIVKRSPIEKKELADQMGVFVEIIFAAANMYEKKHLDPSVNFVLDVKQFTNSVGQNIEASSERKEYVKKYLKDLAEYSYPISFVDAKIITDFCLANGLELSHVERDVLMDPQLPPTIDKSRRKALRKEILAFVNGDVSKIKISDGVSSAHGKEYSDEHPSKAHEDITSATQAQLSIQTNGSAKQKINDNVGVAMLDATIQATSPNYKIEDDVWIQIKTKCTQVCNELNDANPTHQHSSQIVQKRGKVLHEAVERFALNDDTRIEAITIIDNSQSFPVDKVTVARSGASVKVTMPAKYIQNNSQDPAVDALVKGIMETLKLVPNATITIGDCRTKDQARVALAAKAKLEELEIHNIQFSNDGTKKAVDNLQNPKLRARNWFVNKHNNKQIRPN